MIAQSPRYDTIGVGYADHRREDPWVRARVHAALGPARTIVNVAVDAAMAMVTVHHSDEDLEAGVRELRRVARGPVVILTFDAEVSAGMWLCADYLPECAELDRRIFPSMAQLTEWLGGGVTVETMPTAADTPDHTFASFWAHPERVLDPAARAATSGFARQSPEVTDRVVDAVASDLASGAWDERHGRLRGLTEYDAGMRLVVSRSSPSPASAA